MEFPNPVALQKQDCCSSAYPGPASRKTALTLSSSWPWTLQSSSDLPHPYVHASTRAYALWIPPERASDIQSVPWLVWTLSLLASMLKTAPCLYLLQGRCTHKSATEATLPISVVCFSSFFLCVLFCKGLQQQQQLQLKLLLPHSPMTIFQQHLKD